LALLAGVGPMGLGAIDYAIHCDRRPKLLVVTDIDDDRLKRAASIHTVEEAAKNGIKLFYVNTKNQANAVEYIKSLNGGNGFDDVMAFAPVKQVVEQADQLLGLDGCLNFFAGPSNIEFKAELNFYNVHYAFTHIVGTSGGNTSDMRESLEMMAKGTINPAVMVTHIGGLNAVAETTKHLPDIPGGKKLMYTNIALPLTAIVDFAEKGKSDPLFKNLHEIVAKNNGIWSIAAEKYLLQHAEKI
jgi:threonine dehydrogenase-like Zn-dependent dehydrogenase